MSEIYLHNLYNNQNFKHTNAFTVMSGVNQNIYYLSPDVAASSGKQIILRKRDHYPCIQVPFHPVITDYLEISHQNIYFFEKL